MKYNGSYPPPPHQAPVREDRPGQAARRPRPWGFRRPSRVVGAAVLFVSTLMPAARPARAQATFFDPALESVRKASVIWDHRPGPERRVVDMVCLVPDVPTFLEAVASWGPGHAFPVLIDDVETNLKFLRAFRPARVVRFPARVEPIPGDALWSRAVAAVGRAWVEEITPPEKTPRGDNVPPVVGPVPAGPPAVVVSNPASPALAGAVALAAGRFQPLVRWETPKGFDAELTKDEALAYVVALERTIGTVLPNHDPLGDDCDFVTLAAPYPYRYILDGQRQSLDDLFLRTGNDAHRWGFTGRLMGDAVSSVYQAMCALFLQPTDGLLVNTYREANAPWTDYAMTGAAKRLERIFPTNHATGENATLAGWHRLFDPINRHDFLMINTRGGPTSHGLYEGPGGQTADVPESLPVIVHMIHSFSAESPADPDTLAGRWLANGAYVYFGAMNEPGLQSFRTPGLIASFLAENLPLSATFRKIPTEPLGQPWRLMYFGDPLVRLRPVRPTTRVAHWQPVADWPAYAEFRQPAASDPEALRLNWALKTAIFQRQSSFVAQQQVDIPAVLLGIDRERLDAGLRPYYDALLVDVLIQARRAGELIERLGRIPPAARSASVRRHLETAQTAALQRASNAKDFRQALALWNDVIRAPGSRDFVKTFTERVSVLATEPARQNDWRNRLRASLRSGADPANRTVLEEELRSVDKKIGGR